jgi:hypothetical protein
MSSSTYTTTDTSPPATPLNSRQTSRRTRKSSNGTGRRLGKSTSTSGQSLVSAEHDEDALAESDSDSDSADPTPLIHRLRPRTKSIASEHVSEADMDGEDESTEDEEEAGVGSSGPSSRLRSKDQAGSETMDLGSRSRVRHAKLKAKQALKGGEETDSDGEMDVDEDGLDDTVMTEGKPFLRSNSACLTNRTRPRLGLQGQDQISYRSGHECYHKHQTPYSPQFPTYRHGRRPISQRGL